LQSTLVPPFVVAHDAPSDEWYTAGPPLTTVVVPTNRAMFMAFVPTFMSFTLMDATGWDPPTLSDTDDAVGTTSASRLPANAEAEPTNAKNPAIDADFRLRILLPLKNTEEPATPAIGTRARRFPQLACAALESAGLSRGAALECGTEW
jgi:hypothetical protein